MKIEIFILIMCFVIGLFSFIILSFEIHLIDIVEYMHYAFQEFWRWDLKPFLERIIKFFSNLFFQIFFRLLWPIFKLIEKFQNVANK